MAAANGTRTLCTVWGTPVKVKPVFWANVVAVWGLLSWLSGRGKPERHWSLRILVGFLSMLTVLAADVGHAMAHIVSARYAGAPMDKILLSEGMPRTIYHDDDVPPRAHRLRAVGGPIYSALGLMVSLAVRSLAPRGSLAREVAGWSCLGHSFILGSLAPLPFVDGGAILKWTLVDRGQTPEAADEVIRQVDLSLGLAATATGASLAITRRGSSAGRRWLPALGLVAVGGIAIAAALDKIR